MWERIGQTTADRGGSGQGPDGTIGSFACRSSTICIASQRTTSASGHGCSRETLAPRSTSSLRSVSSVATSDTSPAPAPAPATPARCARVGALIADQIEQRERHVFAMPIEGLGGDDARLLQRLGPGRWGPKIAEQQHQAIADDPFGDLV